jgi:tagaturonate epimerase
MALKNLLNSNTQIIPPDQPGLAAEELSSLSGASVYPKSVTLSGQNVYFMARRGTEKLAGVAGLDSLPASMTALPDKKADGEKDGLKHILVTADQQTADVLREELPFLKPTLIGRAPSLGLGDRLGIATPGHARALIGTGLAPFFCQQSIREMARTGRTPQQVQATASLGALEAGWRGGFGSDADHLKTPEDIDYCLAAGFTMFTFDPGDHVNDGADKATGVDLSTAFENLPWAQLECSAQDCLKKYVDQDFALKRGPTISFSTETLMRAAAKYGAAVVHVAKLYRYLLEKSGEGNFEVEVSVDETNSATTVEEHYYIARELERLGVKWVGLAPRFVGAFEKGVDYIGDLDELRQALNGHAAVARTLDPYKLSIHSGSDKFSVYPIAAEATAGMAHVKTAGTSYLEALRTLAAGAEQDLFREILAYAIEHFEEDKKTYHVSAVMDKALKPDALSDAELAPAMDQFDTRQALHVTFGSVLNEINADGQLLFKTRMMQALAENEEMHYEIISKWLGRHAAPFARK